MTESKKVGVILQTLSTLFPETYSFLKHSNSFELLIAVILSAQCTDERVNEVTKSLFKKYKTIKDYAYSDVHDLERLIFSTGFYKVKASYIKNSAYKILKKYNGVVPNNMNDLLTLPGVARKTANVVLYQAFGKNEGIAVDTHVKRLSLKLGLTTSHDPKKIEKDLMRQIPKEQWGDFSWRLIAYGRKFCPAKKHDHQNCPLEKVLN